MNQMVIALASDHQIAKFELIPLSNTDRFIDEAFKIDPELRTVGIMDDNRNILALKTRTGYKQLIPDERAEDYFSILLEVVVDDVNKLRRFLGNMSVLFVRFDEAVLIFYRFHKTIIVFSFEIDIPTSSIDRIPQAFRQIAYDYL